MKTAFSLNKNTKHSSKWSHGIKGANSCETFAESLDANARLIFYEIRYEKMS